MERLKLETIENIIKTHRTVVEVLENENIDDDYDLSLDKCIIYGMEELKQYRIAEEQGLLLRLPCKVGDAVYCLMSAKTKIVETSILWIEKHSNCLVFALAGGFGDVVLANLGETWFLTKEEAEQALAEMKEV